MLLLFVVPIVGATSASAQECGQCDCYHFPVSRNCEKCCAFASGTVTSATNSTIVLREPTPSGNARQRSFPISPNAAQNATPKPGNLVTVYYRVRDGVAMGVDVAEALQGLLEPGTAPDPPIPAQCPAVPESALRSYFGNDVAWASGDELSLITVRGTEILGIRRTRGGLAITAKVFSADGKIVAQIVDNHFYVNPDKFFRIDRDAHSLVVYDRGEVKVLDIKYLNPHSIAVLGVFHVPGFSPILISPNELQFLGTHFSNGCFVNGGISID
jgi:hypothetical protein